MLKKADRELFFSELAASFGSYDVAYAKQFYHAFARFVIKKLKENDKIELPDLGIFYVSRKKGISMTNMNTKERIYLKDLVSVRFKQGWRMREFFNKLASSKSK